MCHHSLQGRSLLGWRPGMMCTHPSCPQVALIPEIYRHAHKALFSETDIIDLNTYPNLQRRMQAFTPETTSLAFLSQTPVINFLCWWLSSQKVWNFCPRNKTHLTQPSFLTHYDLILCWSLIDPKQYELLPLKTHLTFLSQTPWPNFSASYGALIYLRRTYSLTFNRK